MAVCKLLIPKPKPPSLVVDAGTEHLHRPLHEHYKSSFSSTWQSQITSLAQWKVPRSEIQIVSPWSLWDKHFLAYKALLWHLEHATKEKVNPLGNTFPTLSSYRLPSPWAPPCFLWQTFHITCGLFMLPVCQRMKIVFQSSLYVCCLTAFGTFSKNSTEVEWIAG